jgi:hypothetical protein
MIWIRAILLWIYCSVCSSTNPDVSFLVMFQHLQTLPGAEVEATLEIRVKVAEGVEDDVVRTVSENATTLKFETHGFEDD